MLSNLEKQVIGAIQGDMPICERPYEKIAGRLGIAETALLEILTDFCKRGIIRRFGATLRHQKSGYTANVMVAWQVPEDRIEAVGDTLAGFRQVSHCYRRDPTDQWPFNLYTMVHGASPDDCRAVAEEMAVTTGVATYELLFSRRELKKTSMTYFPGSTPA